jgi:hypothetical protein
VAQILIQMITDYKDKIQKRLTDNMVKERNAINQHIKEINKKKSEISIIREGVEEVENELKVIKDNE